METAKLGRVDQRKTNPQRIGMARNRVLVVDDEKNQREIYTLILEDDG